MANQNYTSRINVSTSPEKVFEQINNVAAWWSPDFEGSSEKPGDIFTVRFGETSITLKVVALLTGEKVHWLVTDCYKHWLRDKKEWVGTRIIFDLTRLEKGTQMDFTHIGLVPGLECYDVCEDAWGYYLKGGLLKLLKEEQGVPD